MRVFPAGGIPALQDSDSKEIVETKKRALMQYHIKRGGILNSEDSNAYFDYSLNTVIKNVNKKLGLVMRKETNNRKKRKSQRRKHKSQGRKRKSQIRR